MKKQTIFLVIMVCLTSCSPFKPFTPKLNSSETNCNKLKEFVSITWLKHNKEKAYKLKGSKKEFEDEIYKKYNDCFFNLSIDEIKLLLGEPSEELPNEALTYYLTTDCIQEFPIKDCDILLISFNNSTAKAIALMFQ